MINQRRFWIALTLVAIAATATIERCHASQVAIDLPLHRSAYQTNEFIHLAIIRSDTAALAAGELNLVVTGDDGSSMKFTFPAKAIAVGGADKDARSVEHLYLNGWLLRPGNYKVDVVVDGATATTNIDVHSHIRKSSFVLADWGNRAGKNQQTLMGEESLGFNVILSSSPTLPDELIRAGADFMRCCTMGGAHQMDIRMECDWSDPYVLRGGEARVVRQALADRTSPNCIGVHFYDEPGLTWWKHAKTGEMTPHNIPAQDRSFKSAFGHDPLQYCDVKPGDPATTAQWFDWGRWKTSFMDAAWKFSAFGVSEVRNDLISATQSVYGWNAYADGYYWPITRNLPIIAGHGGYDDLGYGYLFPSLTFEFGRIRDLSKPAWYLPSWYAGQPADHFRAEQYLSFMNNLQGMMKPPDQTVHKPSTAPATVEGIIESNKLMSRLGTIFTAMPVTRPQTAVLYSMSQCLYAQSKDMTDNYSGGNQFNALQMVYLASKMNQTPLFPIADEDILDGTLAAYHKAVILTGIDYLDPRVVTALESFAAGGGTVLLTDDCKVSIKGGAKLGLPVDISIQQDCARLWQEKKQNEMYALSVAPNFFKKAAPLAEALKAKLSGIGIQPVFETESNTIAASRQASGDIEYIFAVNITPDADRHGKNNLKPTTASIGLADDGRPIYDALLGGVANGFAKKNKSLAAQFRFGPGEMRVFARTARPIGSVQALTPTIVRDYTLEKNPVRLELAATLADEKGRILAGAAPLHIRVIDSLGATRYDLYRSTDKGFFHIDLPLAVNDANGEWKVVVRELLNNTEDTVTFKMTTPASCAALSGAAPRAISFGNDRSNIYRFFRTHQDVTIVVGSSDFDGPAAERVIASLKPWDIRCSIAKAADVCKARQLTDEEMHSWCGLVPGAIKPGQSNVAVEGFAVQGPVILIGTPEDNPLIKFAHDQKFLPYTPDKQKFPGRGRGFLSWQRDAVGYAQESVALIAYDADGMNEAAGTLYEAAAGLDPLMPLTPSTSNSIAPAATANVTPMAALKWELALPDRAAAVKTLAEGKALVLTEDGTLTQIDAAGKAVWTANCDGGERWALDASADGKVIVVGASQHVLGFDGAGKPLFDVPFKFKDPGSDTTWASPAAFVAVSPDGSKIAAAAQNGRLLLLNPQGKVAWGVGGVTDDDYAKWQASVKEWEAGIDKRAAEQAAFKKVLEAWKESVKEWDANAKQREAQTAEHRKEVDKWKAAVKEWEKTKQGDKPAESAALVLATKPEQPKGPPNPGRPAEPKAVPYRAGTFSADGKSLIALTDKEIFVINAADGTVGAHEGGAKAGAPLAQVGDKLLISDGVARLALFSPVDGKTIKQISLSDWGIDPKTQKPGNLGPIGVCAAVPSGAGDGAIVAGENDSTVYALKTIEGDQKAAIAWTNTDPLRIVKHIAVKDNVVAVAYWGGFVKILDASNGNLKYAQSMPQDSTFLTWIGAQLVVGLADGRIVALDVK